MKLGLIVSFYDEYSYVYDTIRLVRRVLPDSIIIGVHTDDGESPDALLPYFNSYTKLPDLSIGVEKHAYQAPTICRNFSLGFSNIYNYNTFDFIVAITGDTLIKDTSFLPRLGLYWNSKFAAVSQAIGQRFHAAEDDMITSRENRLQHDMTTDFMPQLFILNGRFAKETKCFSTIPITNPWTSEQCLGDELNSKIISKGESFHNKVYRLNGSNPSNAYAFNDGIVYHARNKGIPGR